MDDKDERVGFALIVLWDLLRDGPKLWMEVKQAAAARGVSRFALKVARLEAGVVAISSPNGPLWAIREEVDRSVMANDAGSRSGTPVGEDGQGAWGPLL